MCPAPPPPTTLELARLPWTDLVGDAPDVLVATTTTGRYVRVSPSCERVLSWTAHDLEGAHDCDFAETADLPLLDSHREEVLRRPGESVTTSYRFRSPDESLRWVELSSRAVGPPGRRFVVSTLRDITEQQRLHIALQQQASTDALTGLSNRVVLLDRLAQGIRRLDRNPGFVAALGLDLDGFKAVNDTLGHAGGDQVLVMLAERLSHHLRPADTLARLGGDEFVIVAEGVSGTAALDRLAQRVVASGRAPYVVNGQSFSCSLSVGVATTKDPACDPHELLREADLALYRAKDHGRDRVEFFDEQLRLRARGRAAAELLVRRSLAEDRLRVQYQPVLDVQSRRVVGAEALVRIVDDEQRLVHPPAFLDVAEATGLLGEIDDHVLRDAVATAATWNGSDLAPVDIALNLTARHLADTGFYGELLAMLATTGLPPERLQVELPERLLIETSKASREGLARLRAAGVQVGMDDFGTGYSSLRYLQLVPVDFVKLDRCLVEELTRSPTARAVVSAVLGVTRALGLSVTAEGVETEGQLEVLADLGCDRAQGFLFAPALPLADLLVLLEDERRVA